MFGTVLNCAPEAAVPIDVVIGGSGGQDERVFHCDRGMLSDNCKYFRALFDFPIGKEGQRKSSSSASVVRLQDITPEAFEDVLDILKVANGQVIKFDDSSQDSTILKLEIA